jgi:D-inositol-3-phosphate glycosyltransferase
MGSVRRLGEYPQRVAMISLHTSPLETPGLGDAGGLNVYVAELARRLGERGLKVDVFTRQTGLTDPVVELNEHARVIALPAGPRGAVPKEDLPTLVGEFSAALESRIDSYDLVHSHYWLSGMAALELKERHAQPFVHTMHTMARVKNAWQGPGYSGEPAERELGEEAIVHAANALTANTSDEAEDLRRLYDADPAKIMIVPPGVDLHTFHPCDQPKSRAQLGVDLDAQVILFVGRIQPLKAPDVLIKALGELVRMDPSRRDRLKLIIIGSPSGPDADWTASLPILATSLDIAEMVEFRPHSERSELFRWYCVSDVVGVPSYNESFGLVALEAQACGRPVVATDVGGLRHAVDDRSTGLLVPGHDPYDWAKALASILDDQDEAVRLGINGAVHASRFSWDNTAAATLQAYHRALTR